jgi:hypothetical protein
MRTGAIDILGEETTGYGIVPIGTIVPVMTAMATCPTPSVADGWALCDGTTAASQGMVSPVITAALPDLNGVSGSGLGAFMRGGDASWASGAVSGGADTHTHTTDIAHAHADNLAFTGPSHSHSSSTGAEAAHTHGAGSYAAGIYASATATFQATASATTFTNTRNSTISTSANTDEFGGSPVAGTSGGGSSHSHSIGADGTGACGKTGGVTSLGATTPTSSSGSTIPVHYNVVYYMRCK